VRNLAAEAVVRTGWAEPRTVMLRRNAVERLRLLRNVADMPADAN